VVVLKKPLKEFRPAVYPNMETVVGGDERRPSTRTYPATPYGKRGNGRIRVRHDEDGDPLSYEYIPNVGRIEGNARGRLQPPQERGPIMSSSVVSDPRGVTRL